MFAQQIFDPNLIAKYNSQGPRYTSYPTALEFSDSFFNDDFIKAVKTSANQFLSIYLHIPFCKSLCYYCGCNKIITQDEGKAEQYLEYLELEISTRGELFKHHQVSQLHLGGGSPSFLTPDQLTRLFNLLRTHFNFLDDAELSIEIDPRGVTESYLSKIREIGFNRLSMGVQDTTSKVQEAINRCQSTNHIAELVRKSKSLGFRSTNLDLIYGLPFQSQQSFAQTLNEVMEMDVERISLFSYAHMPSRFASQRKIKDHWLPDTDKKFNLMRQAIETLTKGGYDFIGMDHFAKPSDALSQAQKEHKLQRNFQGYCTDAETDLLGLGVSSISFVGNSYSQNQKDIKSYYQSLLNAGHAVNRGVILNHDDGLRAHVISELMCNLQLDVADTERRFDICFADYFHQELLDLTPFVNDELLTISDTFLRIAPQARLLVRNICMQFDYYLQHQQNNHSYSKVI